MAIVRTSFTEIGHNKKLGPTMEGDKKQESVSIYHDLDEYELHGWKPETTLSFDDNMMDVVMLVTRNSTCQQGSMACILVNPPTMDDQICEETIKSSIISVAINRSLYQEGRSDIHAEISALGSACRQGTKTEGCSVYITMPPCKNCFGALVTAGVKRIVTRLKCLEPVLGAANKHGIELVVLDKGEERMARINQLIYGNPRGAKREAPATEDQDQGKKTKSS